jgi:Nucleoside-diphosphate-sugar epimerases
LKKKTKILIIGGSGYLGFNLIKKLDKKIFLVTSVSRKKSQGKKKVKNVKYIQCDISKKKDLKKIKKDFEIVFNFCGNVDHKNKMNTIRNHFTSSKNLINHFEKSDLKKFFQIGSGLEYKGTNKSNNERDQLEPKGHYGLAKKMASSYCLKKFYSNGFPATILRLYQIYGPSQDLNRLIPQAIFSLKRNKMFKCSHGEQYRDFLFIDDLTNIFIKLIKTKKKIKGKVFNIGSGQPD